MPVAGGRGYKELNVLTLHPEFAEEILLASGAHSVTFIDAADNPVLEPAPGETPLWPRTRTVGLFDRSADLKPAIAALHDTLPDGRAAVVTTARLPDKDWVRIWLRDWKPLRFGARLWVTPHAKRGQIRQKDAVIVTLDPGLAFGTGTHPTTGLCLEWLAGADVKGKTVLDYGCGSGLLAIAALKLGARSADAADIDPQALTATRDNARINGVARKLKVYRAPGFAAGLRYAQPSLLKVAPSLLKVAPSLREATYDLVLANILSGPLVTLAPRLIKACKPGGTLILAGLLEHHAREVRAAYAPKVKWKPGVRREGWVRLEGIRAPLMAPAVKAPAVKVISGRSRAGRARPTRAR